MNKKNVLFFTGIIILIIATTNTVLATEPTQQYNKIYLNPFYRANLIGGTNYTYNVTVNPPDGMSNVNSAIISWNAQIGGTTQTFNLKVNNQTCNTASYVVSTTYSSTGNVQFSFDCSNIINHVGTYTIILNSAVNTGAISGSLDLTYMNNPVGTAELMGTEYQIGDQATIFLQLKNSQGLPVNNGSCYLDVYYPTSYNTSHPEMLNNAPMIFKEEGLYYYDLITPNYTGVYMTTATCNYALNQIWYYPSGEINFFPNQTIETGTWTGTTLALNDLYDYQWQKATRTAGNPITANYTWDVSSYGNLSNITNLNVYFTGQSSTAGTLTIAYWNGTAFINLSNVLTYLATGSSTSITFSDQLLTNSIPLSAIINNSVKLKLTSTGSGTYYVFYNWLSLAVLTATGTVQELKGSSEMHISNMGGGIISNITTQLNNILLTIMNDYNLTRDQINSLNITIISLQTNIANNFTNIQNILSTINGQNNLTQEMIINTNLTIHQSITDTQNLINALNTTLFAQFNITNQNTQNMINQLQANITNQINLLTSQIDAQYNNLMATLNLIYAQVNLTDNRLINFSIATNQTLQQILLAINTDYNLTTAQILQIQNYLITMNNNISFNCQEIQNQLISIANQQNLSIIQLQSINQSINQNIFDTQNLINSINQSLMTRFGIIDQKIDDLQNNLTIKIDNLQTNISTQLNNILDYLIIINQTTTETKNLAQQIWDYIIGWLNGTITDINIKLDILLNQTNSTIDPITITANAEDCITGSNWIMEATVRGHYGEILDNNSVACNLTTTMWGTNPMSYNTGVFTYYNLCPDPSNWTWMLECNQI